jgi:hypothetical protein
MIMLDRTGSEPRSTPGHAVGIVGRLMAAARGGSGKKQSGRTPLEPKRTPAHHLNRWRDEGRANLVLEGIRLGILDSSRQPVGRWAQFRTWKTLAIAVERARRGLDS